MAATKITSLTPISTIDTAVDPLPIVDVSDTSQSASGTTKKVTVDQIESSIFGATGSKAIVVDNVAALKALTVASVDDGQLFLTRGYYTENDGGQGTYVYDAGSSTADNGGTVIAPTSGTGRYLLQYSGAINVKQFGAYSNDTNGATTSSSIQSAINNTPRGCTLFFPQGTYRIESSLTFAGSSQCIAISGTSESILKFYSLGASVDCFVVSGTNYPAWSIKNLQIDCNATGRDGVVIRSGNRCELFDVSISNSQRDSLHIDLGSSYLWLENFSCKTSFNACGRHAINITVGSSLSDIDLFFNEAVFYMCELRGCARRYTGGTFINATTTSNYSGASVSELTFIDCNIDGDRAAAQAAGFDIYPNPIKLNYVSGSQNLFDSWRFLGGSWETTSGSPTSSLYIADLGSGSGAAVVRAFGWTIYGLNPSNWSSLQPHPAMADVVVADKTYGRLLGDHINSNWTQTTASASSTFDVDVNLPRIQVPVTTYLVTRSYVQSVVDLLVSYQRFAGTNAAQTQFYTSSISFIYFITGADQYSVVPIVSSSASGSYYTVNSVTALNSSNTTTLNVANPPVKLRINITTAAAFADFGGDNRLFINCNLKTGSHNAFNV